MSDYHREYKGGEWMLNSKSTSTINQNIKFNAVSGTMFKSCAGSYFRRFHLNSKLADGLFSQDYKVVALQTMIVGDMEVLAELIDREKYEVFLTNE